MAKTITINASEVCFDFESDPQNGTGTLLVIDGDVTLRLECRSEQLDALALDFKSLAGRARNDVLIGDTIGKK